MPTTEVLLIEASDAFRKDPKIAIPAMQLTLQTKGVHGPVYYGKQVAKENEPSTWGYFVVDWDDYSTHKAFMDGSTCGDVASALKDALSGQMIIYHVQFSGPLVALKQPVTSISIISLKDPGVRPAVESALATLSETSGKVFVYGQTREDENKYITIGGWASIEAHSRVGGKPEVAAALEKLISLTTKEHLCHTELLQYPM